MKKTLLLCAFLVGLVSSNVMALTLDEARTQGRVGETFYGYLVALKTDAETITYLSSAPLALAFRQRSSMVSAEYVPIRSA